MIKGDLENIAVLTGCIRLSVEAILSGSSHDPAIQVELMVLKDLATRLEGEIGFCAASTNETTNANSLIH